MASIRFISGKAALSDYIQRIHAGVDTLLGERNINATGVLKKSNRTSLTDGAASVSATLEAFGYWKTAGSGSPPGTIVKGDALVKWALAKGLAINERKAARLAINVMRTIKEKGSKQYREGGKNVYIQAIEEQQSTVPDLIKAFLGDFKEPIASEFKRAIA